MMAGRLVVWGGYDDSKPRVRLLIDALRRTDALEAEIPIRVWDGVADKSIAGRWRILRSVLRLITGIPSALWKLSRTPRGTAILLPYPGTPEIFLIAPLARLTGRKLVFDAFLPLHDTVIADRRMAKDGGMTARILRMVEGAGLRLSDIVLVDTDEHGNFLARDYGIDPGKFVTVLVGAEPQFAAGAANQLAVDEILGPADGRRIVLFYGQLIPLHGLSTILAAARQAELDGEAIRWVLVGSGQQDKVLEDFLADKKSSNISWIRWVDYERLPALIARADVCLGIFGGSGKAGRVIPNKLFQTLAMGKPVITRQSPAMARLAASHPRSIRTVPAEDPAALLGAVKEMLADPEQWHGLPPEAMRELGPDSGVRELLERLGRG